MHAWLTQDRACYCTPGHWCITGGFMLLVRLPGVIPSMLWYIAAKHKESNVWSGFDPIWHSLPGRGRRKTLTSNCMLAKATRRRVALTPMSPSEVWRNTCRNQHFAVWITVRFKSRENSKIPEGFLTQLLVDGVFRSWVSFKGLLLGRTSMSERSSRILLSWPTTAPWDSEDMETVFCLLSGVSAALGSDPAKVSSPILRLSKFLISASCSCASIPQVWLQITCEDKRAHIPEDVFFQEYLLAAILVHEALAMLLNSATPSANDQLGRSACTKSHNEAPAAAMVAGTRCTRYLYLKWRTVWVGVSANFICLANACLSRLQKGILGWCSGLHKPVQRYLLS